MPELPEVETVRRGLSRLLPGLRIAGVYHDNTKSFPNTTDDVAKFLIGATIVGIDRRAKVLVIGVSTGYSLMIHLKMTGQLVFRSQTEDFGAGHPNDSLVGALPDRSTRVTITFADGSSLYFNDQRKFGWVRLLPTRDLPDVEFFTKVGPEPLDSRFGWLELEARLRRGQRRVSKRRYWTKRL